MNVMTRRSEPSRPSGQVVLVLQGGGASAPTRPASTKGLSEAGIEPDWVIGTSIGAINAAIIAGNKPADRLDRLKAFWDRVCTRSSLKASWLSMFGNAFANLGVLTQGVPGFFQPNPNALVGHALFRGSGPRRVLRHRSAQIHAVRPDRRRVSQQPGDARDGRRGERRHRRDALFRQPRHAAGHPPHHGIGRAAAGLPRDRDRRRALLGRRRLFQHADRSGVRRHAAP